MPDLEPASALAERISSLLRDQHFEERVAELIAERDSVREPLETQLDELRRRLHEQADVIAERDRRIGELQARIYELEGQLANTHDVLVSLRGERNDLKAEALKAERAADARIAELEAQLAAAPRWIPVEERKPASQSVWFVWCGDGDRNRYTAMFDGEWFTAGPLGWQRLGGVTHMMPLPSPPTDWTGTDEEAALSPYGNCEPTVQKEPSK